MLDLDENERQQKKHHAKRAIEKQRQHVREAERAAAKESEREHRTSFARLDEDE
jgi:hypothetical protein